MNRILLSSLAGVLALALALALVTMVRAAGDEVHKAAPIRALMITGGGFHDYARQKVVLSEGISARANVQWTIFDEDGDTRHKLSIYSRPDFAKGFDVILHNECYADVDDPAFVERALAPHRAGVPAVVLHCTLHTFRALKSDAWREFIGMSSNHHGKPTPISVQILAAGNPIMRGFPASWITGPEELYSINKVWPNATPLAEAYSSEEKKEDPVVWTNLYLGRTRVFGTSLAHETKTMEDPAYLALVTRGLLWACGKLDEDGMPKAGYGAEGNR